MVKLLIAITAAVTLYGIDFETFENRALQISPDIESAKLQKDIALLEKEIALRYENPSVEAEIGSFDADPDGRHYGWRLGVSQPFRVTGVQKDLKRYGETLTDLAEAEYKKGRAAFKAALRRQYTEYVAAVYYKRLQKEEIELAKRLESIADERLRGGGGTKAALMQASLERISAQNGLIEYERQVLQRYFELLNLAGTAEKPDLEARFLYPMDNGGAKSAPASPDIAVAEKEAELLLAEAAAKSRVVKGYRLMGELEREPDQSIVRIGAAMDIPLFNRTNQEYRIAKIRAKQSALKKERLAKSQEIRLLSLQNQLKMLKKRYEALQSRLEKERQLLLLFEEGYRMAQSSLLDLIRTKNSLIETRRQLLKTIYLGNIYRIEIDYLKGKYDE